MAPPSAAMRDAVLRVAFSSLEAVLVLAALATAMRATVLRIVLSPLEAALVLAPLAPSMRDAVLRAAFNGGLKAAIMLAAFASSMRLAVLGVAFSGLQAVFLLAPPASSVRLAVERPVAADSCPWVGKLRTVLPEDWGINSLAHLIQTDLGTCTRVDIHSPHTRVQTELNECVDTRSTRV
jgi:hypothetical protein